MLALFMTSPIQTVEYKMATLTIFFDFFKRTGREIGSKTPVSMLFVLFLSIETVMLLRFSTALEVVS